MNQKIPKHDVLPAIIGFGEAARAFVEGWKSERVDCVISAYDIKTDSSDPIVVAGKFQDYLAAGVNGAIDLNTLQSNANAVFCLVTADQARVAASAASRHIRPETFYFDGNSCAPKTKQECARLIEGAGAVYIDMAIMAPVYPKLHRTPILLSGLRANDAQEMLSGFGMAVRVESGPVGRASSIKMIRSIMVKGMEALMAECILAGRRADVEDIVLDSLEKSWPGFGWKARASYNLERMMVHGERRAAEMREVAQTIDYLGLENGMAVETARWQQCIGELGLDPGEDNLESRIDAVLAAMNAAIDPKGETK